LEERFNENAICFEPGFEMVKMQVKKDYNIGVEYNKYKVCIADVLGSNKFSIFKAEMEKELVCNAPYLLQRLEVLKNEYKNGNLVVSPYYRETIKCDFDQVLESFKGLMMSLPTKT
jgi:hypothetical protein